MRLCFRIRDTAPSRQIIVLNEGRRLSRRYVLTLERSMPASAARRVCVMLKAVRICSSSRTNAVRSSYLATRGA